MAPARASELELVVRHSSSGRTIWPPASWMMWSIRRRCRIEMAAAAQFFCHSRASGNPGKQRTDSVPWSRRWQPHRKRKSLNADKRRIHADARR